MRSIRVLYLLALVAITAGLALMSSPTAYAQSNAATLSGTVLDPTGAVIPDVKVTLVNKSRNVQRDAVTNKQGIFVLPQLDPGTYKLRAVRNGFASVEVPGITLSTADSRDLRVEMKIGKTTETITVEAPAVDVSAAAGLVVGPKFVDSIPLNGRTLQALIFMAPGVVLSTTEGQFSVNGLRDTENYFTIDGVSANAGINASAPQYTTNLGSGNSVGYSAQGTTSNLVSLDSLQEFKIQTSTYAAQYGRLAGGQVQLTTKSGGFQFHGTAYDYLRNDVLDANNWMNNNKKMKKSPLRQNNFGGTFSGPIIPNKTTFFASYEGMRLRSPQTTINNLVPDTWLRENANPIVKPFLNAYPLPNGGPYIPAASTTLFACAGTATTLPTCPWTTHQALFSAGYSTLNNGDAGSMKIDHILSKKMTINARYNYAPSYSIGRTLAITSPSMRNTRSLTVGTNIVISKNVTNGLNYNWTSYDTANDRNLPEAWKGAQPLPASLAFPGPLYDPSRSYVSWTILGYAPTGYNQSAYQLGVNYGHNINRQNNITDNLVWVHGKHRFGFGVDAKKLDPWLRPQDYSLGIQLPDWSYFVDGAYTKTGSGTTASPYVWTPTANVGKISGYPSSQYLGGFHNHYLNFSSYAQDTWKVFNRLTVDYGVRWDVNPAPGTNPGYIYFNGFEDGYANMQVGRPLYPTVWTNVAPRFGAVYALQSKKGWATVVRGGYGQFLSTQTLGIYANTSMWPNITGLPNVYPTPAWYINPSFYGPGCTSVPMNPTTGCRSLFTTSGTNSAELKPPNPSSINLASTTPYFISGNSVGIGKGIVTPRTHQWSFGLEQAIGKANTLKLTYSGNAARHLMRTGYANSTDIMKLKTVCRNTSGLGDGSGSTSCFNSTTMVFVQNRGGFGDTSDYNALQVEFLRRTGRMQTTANFTWSKALDTSYGEYNLTNSGTYDLFTQPPNKTRGISNYNRRYVANVAFSYEIPQVKGTGLLPEPVGQVVKGVVNGWSFAMMGKYQSAAPLDIYYSGIYASDNPDTGFYHKYRPNMNPDQPLWIADPNLWPMKKLNFDAFIIPGCINGTGTNACPGGTNSLPPGPGTMFRNQIMGFGFYQANIEIKRTFKLTEKTKLDFMADMYNVTNHPAFNNPGSLNLGTVQYSATNQSLNNVFTSSNAANFGKIQGMLYQSLGGLSSLYQMGGPRSCQFALKLIF